RRRSGGRRGGCYAAGAGEEVEGGRGEGRVVAGADEAALAQGGVEDARPGKVLLGLEGVEHQDAGLAREPAVVEEAEGQVPHGHAVSSPRLTGACDERAATEFRGVVRPCQDPISPRSAWTRGQSPSGTPIRRGFQGIKKLVVHSRARAAKGPPRWRPSPRGPVARPRRTPHRRARTAGGAPPHAGLPSRGRG